MDNTLSQCRLQDNFKKKEHIVADLTGVVTVSLHACHAGNWQVGLPLPGNNDASFKTQKKRDPSHLRPCSSCCSLGQPCLWVQLNAQFINILYLPISVPRLASIPGQTMICTHRGKVPVYQTCMFLDTGAEHKNTRRTGIYASSYFLHGFCTFFLCLGAFYL